MKHKILLDCDPGVDDAIAILHLATLIGRGEAELTAVGTVHGNVTSAVASVNALRVLELIGLGEVPVATGAARPMAQELHVAADVHGIDGLGETHLSPPAGSPTGETAAGQLVRLARAHPGELTILALGPLTNLGLALLLEPELPELVREVVVMGGALDVPGNITSHAEANIWHDPEAAELVLSAPWPAVLVPLDATMPTALGAGWLDRLAAADSAIARFSTRVLEHYSGYYTRWLGHRTCVIHDALAAVIAVDPAIATYERAPVRVELRGEHTRGATVWDRRHGAGGFLGVDDRVQIKVAVGSDVTAFQERLLASLT